MFSLILPYPSDSCLLLRSLCHLHPSRDLLISDSHFRGEERSALHEFGIPSEQRTGDGEEWKLEVIVTLRRDTVVFDGNHLLDVALNIIVPHNSSHNIILVPTEDNEYGGELGSNQRDPLDCLVERDLGSDIEHDDACTVSISLDSSVVHTGPRVFVDVEHDLSDRRRELKSRVLDSLGCDVLLHELASTVASEERSLSDSARSNQQSLGGEGRGRRRRGTSHRRRERHS